MHFVNYEDVAMAADDILCDGEEPSVMRVREYLNDDSPNIIYAHLARWRHDRPPNDPPGPTVPPEVPSELTDRVRQAMEDHAAAQVRDLKVELDHSRNEATRLAAVGNFLEEEIEELSERVEAAEAGFDKAMLDPAGDMRTRTAEAELDWARDRIQQLEARLAGQGAAQ